MIAARHGLSTRLVKKRVVVVAASLVLAVSAWCSSLRADDAKTPTLRGLQKFEFSQPEMGVSFKLLLYAADEATANKAAQAAFARLKELNGIFSDYDPHSELSRLSATAGSGKGVPVSDPLWDVLSQSQAWSQASEGAFDITVGRIVKLWRIARRAKRMPPEDQLREALATVGYERLQLDCTSHTAVLQTEGTQLDLGGIAKGYATDAALQVLREHGCPRALVDGGGDISLGDPPPGRGGWRIGVAPLDAAAEPSQFLTLANCAVATSGDAFQHVTLNGVRYSHIVNPQTGLGLSNISSVTIIAPSGATADALASAVSLLGPERGLALVEKQQGVSAFIVRPEDGRVVTCASKDWKADSN